MRPIDKIHPLRLERGQYWPECRHCIAGLIAEVLGEELHVDSIAWSLVDRVAEEMPDILIELPTRMWWRHRGDRQRELDREAVGRILNTLKS